MPHQSEFAAGVRDLGRKRYLSRNHLSLFAAVASNLIRKGGLRAKINHVTRNSKNKRAKLLLLNPDIVVLIEFRANRVGTK